MAVDVPGMGSVFRPGRASAAVCPGNAANMTALQADVLTESLIDDGYLGIALDRMVAQTAEVLGADQACLCVADQGDTSIVAAAHGADDLIGARVASGDPLLVETDDSSVTTIPLGGDAGARLVLRNSGPPRALAALRQSLGTAVGQLRSRALLMPGVAARIRELAVTLDVRDGYTAEHSEEVVGLASAAARRMGLRRAALRELELAALLHDLGKINVPDTVLCKPGPLDPAEVAVMQRHPADGARLLSRVLGMSAVAGIVRFHHERWDGGGYPDGLSGEHIPLASRIIAVCDSFHAMTSHRPYRAALSTDEAFERLRHGAGTQFDPIAVDHVVASISHNSHGSARTCA
jgi:putative nucleotidyltransferase with HDIG domain